MFNFSFQTIKAIVVVFVIALFFVGCKNDTKTAKSNEAATTMPQPTTAQPTPMPSFEYSAPVPVDGTKHGIVELGATGFNSFIVAIDANKNWKLEKAEFGSSLVTEHMATEEEIKGGLKNYIQKMLDSGVKGNNIHFVVSSGAKEEDAIKKIIKALTSMKYQVNTVTAEQEAGYALKAALPKEYEGKAFVIDMGSANTKVSYVKDGKVTGMDTYGSKYFQKGTSETDAYNGVKQVAGSIPSDRTEICFIIGGVPFELAKQTRKDKERYTILNVAANYQPSGDKQKAGVNIYKAIADATGCKKFVFDWDANFAIGFLIDLKK